MILRHSESEKEKNIYNKKIPLSVPFKQLFNEFNYEYIV